MALCVIFTGFRASELYFGVPSLEKLPVSGERIEKLFDGRKRSNARLVELLQYKLYGVFQDEVFLCHGRDLEDVFELLHFALKRLELIFGDAVASESLKASFNHHKTALDKHLFGGHSFFCLLPP